MRAKSWLQWLGSLMLLASVMALGIVIFPYFFAWHYIGTMAQASAPLISAIERFQRDSGRFPEKLSELVPSYISRIPHTGFPPQEEFYYYQGDADGVYYFQLYVFTEVLSLFESDEIQYDSRVMKWQEVRVE